MSMQGAAGFRERCASCGEEAVEPGLYANDFANAFSRILEESGASCYRIAQFANLDQAYLSRLRSGEKANPSPETVMKICLGLVRASEKATLHDCEKLFRSVGRSLRIR